MTVGLRTSRLCLRAYTEADVAAVRDLYSRAEVQRYLGNGRARLDTDRLALQKIRDWERDFGAEPVHGVWAVEHPEHGVVGTLLLKPIPDSVTRLGRDIEIGWHVHPDHWGHGYATEAAGGVVDHAWRGGLRRIVAVTNPANGASKAVCERLGMRHLGLSDAYYDQTCELYDLHAPEART